MIEYVYTYAFKLDGKWMQVDRVWSLKSDAGNAAGFYLTCCADEGQYPAVKLVRVKVPQ